ARLNRATLAQPSGMTTDGEYLFWVDAESSSIRRVALASGNAPVETLAGKALYAYGDLDGPSRDALFQHPQGVAFADGGLFVADTYNHKVRVLDLATLSVSTVAGTGDRGLLDGEAAASLFNEPGGLAAGLCRVYVADTNNSQLRSIDITSGLVSTLPISNAPSAAHAGDRVVRGAIPGLQVAPAARRRRVRIRSPAGDHLNGLAQSRLDLKSSDSVAVRLGQQTLQWSGEGNEIEVRLPVTTSPGSATHTAAGTIYYCRSGEDSICLVHELEITLPVAISSA